jgi:hypothetical protein
MEFPRLQAGLADSDAEEDVAADLVAGAAKSTLLDCAVCKRCSKDPACKLGSVQLMRSLVESRVLSLGPRSFQVP